MRFLAPAGLVLSLAMVACFSPSTDDDTDEGTSAAATTMVAATAADESTTAGAATPSCSEYCGLIGDHCEGPQEQYSGTSVCEAVCAALPVGTVDDQLGNTVGCRTYHSIAATEDPETHCVHAGAGGASVCGAPCETFCGLAAQLCTGAEQQFADTEACLAECMMFPDDVPVSSGATDGDSYACRLYHLTVAALQPDVHCPHIGLDSPVCVAAGGSTGG
jgi:hypothetical protein